MKKSKELFNEIREEQQKITEDASLGEIGVLEALMYMRGFKDEAEKVIETYKRFESDFMDEISNEADANNNVFNGFEIKEVKGRVLFDFKDIPEFKQANEKLKDIQETYKQAFNLAQKGSIEVVDGEWLSSDGELKPLPKYNVGKGYIKITKQK